VCIGRPVRHTPAPPTCVDHCDQHTVSINWYLTTKACHYAFLDIAGCIQQGIALTTAKVQAGSICPKRRQLTLQNSVYL
jgi:hypothetical protein